MYICCRESSSSLFLSSRVFPSSAAKWRSGNWNEIEKEMNKQVSDCRKRDGGGESQENGGGEGKRRGADEEKRQELEYVKRKWWQRRNRGGRAEGKRRGNLISQKKT